MYVFNNNNKKKLISDNNNKKSCHYDVQRYTQTIYSEKNPFLVMCDDVQF